VQPILSKHRLWSLIRYVLNPPSDVRLLFLPLNIALGLALLANVSIQTTWSNAVQSFSLLSAGLSPFNSSLAQTYPISSNFWSYYPSIFTDGTTVFSVPANSCSGANCFSYFFPGGANAIEPNPASQTAHPEASGIVVYNTPGYQVEFYPLSSSDSLSLTDCTIYGWNSGAVQICVKQSGNDLITGISPVVI
jgi:hypothetical protein